MTCKSAFTCIACSEPQGKCENWQKPALENQQFPCGMYFSTFFVKCVPCGSSFESDAESQLCLRIDEAGNNQSASVLEPQPMRKMNTKFTTLTGWLNAKNETIDAKMSRRVDVNLASSPVVGLRFNLRSYFVIYTCPVIHSSHTCQKISGAPQELPMTTSVTNSYSFDRRNSECVSSSQNFNQRNASERPDKKMISGGSKVGVTFL